MTTYPTPIPHGLDVALFGLDSAAQRLHDACARRLIGNPTHEMPLVVVLSESLFWIASLDELGRETKPDYTALRSASGRVVGGLVYARNFHTHELISATETAETVAEIAPGKLRPGEATLPKRPRVPFYAIQLRWAPFGELPKPDPKHREKRYRDLMYQDCVALQPLTRPIDNARTWLRSTLCS